MNRAILGGVNEYKTTLNKNFLFFNLVKLLPNDIGHCICVN